MIKYPKLKVSEFKLSKDLLLKDFTKNDILELFNGKNSTEDIYAHLLSNKFSLENINKLFQSLTKNGDIKDEISYDSKVLSKSEIETYSGQINTFSLYNQANTKEDSNYLNLLFGLKCQEKINQLKTILLGDSNFINDFSFKCEQVGIKSIYTFNHFQKIDIDGDVLVYSPENYDENTLIDTLRYCKEKQIAFLPVIKTNYGVEVGPFYLPNDSSCSLCLITRKKSVLEDDYDSNLKDVLMLNFAIGADLILLELVKFITGIAPVTLRNKILQYNFISGSFKYHSVLKLPNCEICFNNSMKPKRRLWEGIV
jgi:hypothetical protein